MCCVGLWGAFGSVLLCLLEKDAISSLVATNGVLAGLYWWRFYVGFCLLLDGLIAGSEIDAISGIFWSDWFAEG